MPAFAAPLRRVSTVADEWVWTNVKHDRIARTGVTSAADLKATAIGALRRLQQMPHIIRGFFTDPHLAYITI